MNEFTKHLEQQNTQSAMAMIRKHGYQKIGEQAATMITFVRQEDEHILELLFAMAGMTEKIQDLERENENIKKFFSLIISSLIQFGYRDILDTENMSDESWDNLHYLFDMIISGLQWSMNNDIQHEEEYTPLFIQKYGEHNPYRNVIWEIVNFNVQGTRQSDFARFLTNVQHLVPMFASFLGNKNKDGFINSFKKNALTEYFKKIAPKQKTQNFRKKDPNTIDPIYEKIAKKNNLIRHSQQQEYTGRLIATIRDNNISGVDVSIDSLQLRHPATGAKKDLPFIYGKSESELLDIVQNFLDNEVANVFLSQEPENLPEVTLEIIDEIRRTLDEMDIDGITLFETKQLLQYQDQTISLSEIAVDGTYEINIRIWMSEFDGTMDRLAEKIKQDQLRGLSGLQEDCNLEENGKDDAKEEDNTPPDEDDYDLPF